MATLEKKSFNSPDETRSFNKGKVELTTVGGTTFGRATFEPGWKWSNDVKPLAKTDSCQSLHTMYVISGKMHIVLDDGSEMDVEPGDVAIVHPGHNAWVVGDEPCVSIDTSIADSNYAKPAE
jgi:mannose-6-phosphate isomerase-like protein (cupin superfamily)